MPALFLKPTTTMALKPTIYKARINLCDLNKDYYDILNLTLALHPSENLPRMVARVLACCLEAEQQPEFTKGLSEIEQPDLWKRNLQDEIELWIEVGEPAPERVKKATRQAKLVKIFSFNSKSDTWYSQQAGKLAQYPAEIYQLPWAEVEQLAEGIERSIDWTVTLSGNDIFVSTEQAEVALAWQQLQGSQA